MPKANSKPNQESKPSPAFANLTPGGKPHYRQMRRLRVDRLPPDAQDLVAAGLSRGDSLEKISADLKALGHRVGCKALSNFWRYVWRDEHDRLRRARFVKQIVKQALQLGPGSTSSEAAEELLYTLLCDKLPEIEGWKPTRLLHEAREQKKLNPRASPAPSAPSRSPAEQAREVRRRWRQLYGLENDTEGGDDNGAG